MSLAAKDEADRIASDTKMNFLIFIALVNNFCEHSSDFFRIKYTVQNECGDF